MCFKNELKTKGNGGNIKKWEKSGNKNVKNLLNVFKDLMNFYDAQNYF